MVIKRNALSPVPVLRPTGKPDESKGSGCPRGAVWREPVENTGYAVRRLATLLNKGLIGSASKVNAVILRKGT